MEPRLEIVEKPHPGSPVACEPWRPRGPAIAARIMALIQARLPETRIEHIGSSAVPGCAGKNFVDLLIPYVDAAHLRAIDGVLFALGFGRQRRRDPFPDERPLRIGAIDWEGEVVPLHVHVVPADSPEIAELMEFRDRLRADPALCAAYVAQKRAILAAGIVDGASYAEAKGPFILAVLAGKGA
ncbi:MAG TPA: GrpB family protein [Thermomicrobiales bacterium]|nr:GrpB family protein [Thermomicrobiales bacterium]